MAPNRIPTIPVKPAGPSNSTLLSAFATLEKYLKLKKESNKDFLLKMAALFQSLKNGDSLFPYIIKLFKSAAKAVTRVDSGSSSSNSTVNSSHEYVEMGDGLKWATCNLGASKPEEVGDYIAWGETSPFYSSYDPLVWKEGSGFYGFEFNKYFVYDASDAKTPFFSIKYNDSDGKTVLESADDAASVNWGGNWRMPTAEEWETLLDKDRFTWTPGEKNGKKGFTVTSKVKGYVGNSIFLPAGADFIGVVPLGRSMKSWGYYWSSSKTGSLNDQTASRALFFDTDSSSSGSLGVPYVGRYTGLPIRAVSK